MSTIIHVARQQIPSNAKHGTDDPVLIINRKGKPKRSNSIILNDKNGNLLAEFKYSAHSPLKCGARAWLEVNEDNVDII